MSSNGEGPLGSGGGPGCGQIVREKNLKGIKTGMKQGGHQGEGGGMETKKLKTKQQKRMKK